ncbi:class I SAM-dependent methyltransferase [Paenibacillus apiarius]|uniref:Class I SAM-dependent methyltransferase n=1 Tax=Paenibacillus apiarius TaxID=46240 RepID=A0ABT4DRA3_9BACL|nr:class I SAM-dependent methyltransferase [Paenibacillus apiarius]MCY9516726.1 class I SAM-dependent methyltransferase [Paenibacillus apiarius]MCY9519876.1 class I SAM-dependent methyltransferase [Paenibacillus apiarius]MCY9553886.1 class I SAM-dependent methyltransferase [Paenibacillus apiarius]MCY9557506.1 class I SAM-dependent methyltransferase [Paenibacillus apiarius]MCY9685466.1 class I SAM-dependent methyltransferase [Paenibacillus apiarius]
MFSYYGELSAEVYDFTKPVGHSINGDIEYYRERLHTCSGRILEAGIGTGRMLIPLLEAGMKVDGIDYSAEMLAVCRTRMAERNLHAELYEGNLQQFSLPHNYEAIIMPAGTFLLIEKREESIHALKCIYKHLVPGGRFIVDIFLPDYSGIDFSIGNVHTTTHVLPYGDLITMEQKVVEVDFLHQHQVSYLKYEKWREGKLIQTELQRFALRWYGVEELKLLLESVGFNDIVCSADYEFGAKPARETQMFTFEARK